LADETSRRRPDFRDGTRIRLADGQKWTLPAPPKPTERIVGPFPPQYDDLIQAVRESETASDRRLAELALAIFLLGHNYRLSATDYEQLLGFAPESEQLADWQSAFGRIAQDHVDSAEFDFTNPLVDQRPSPSAGRLARLRIWLRNYVSYPARALLSERD
jgi:hypothetical protein